MKRRVVLKIILILAGTLILTQCRPPTPVAAAVGFAPGVGADADQPAIKELVAAFNEAEAAVKKADLDALMTFYATAYNYHGLKRSDVRRVWEEVFLHYRDISSSHVFTELKLVQADGVRKAYVTCTGGLQGTEKQTGKPVAIDSWAREVHYLVNGIPSHVAPETPGSIHEGGELGYSLSHAYGTVFDNPDLIAACVVGDGEAETGPLATSCIPTNFSTRSLTASSCPFSI